MIVKNDMKKVTLLIPVYNEEAMLPTLYQRLIELVNRNAVYEWEILFVNDGSSDTTLECLRRLRQQDKRVNYVNLSRNFGKEVAMLAGFDYATGDCCVVMDPEELPKLHKNAGNGISFLYKIKNMRIILLNCLDDSLYHKI